MDQIRFDFFSTQAIGAPSRTLPAPAPASDDAFSQVLDRQMARARDTSPSPSPDSSRGADGWRRSADDADRPAAKLSTSRKRDDQAAPQAQAAKPKAAKTAETTAKSPADKTTDTADAAKAPTTAKAKPDDDKTDKKDISAEAQPPSDPSATAKPAEDLPAPKTDPDGQQQQQQQGDSDRNSTPAQPQDVDASASAEVDLAALMIPLPLQAIGTAASVKASTAASAGTPSAALQAALLVAANLSAGPVNLAADANAQGKASAPGLKFGAVLPDPTPKAGADPSGAAVPGSDQSDPAAAATDPTTVLPVSQQAQKQMPKAQTAGGTKPRSSNGSTASASPVTAAYAGQNAAAAATQPAGAGIASAWSTRGGTAESALPTPAVVASADSGLSDLYSGADGAGIASSAVTARNAAFLAELKQNVRVPPAHEQIAIQIQKAMQNGSNRLTVSLEPAELGRVEVKLDVDKDKNVTASIVVDRPATLDLLQRDAKALERALQDAGLQTNDGSLSFSLRNGAGQGGGGSNGQSGAGIGGGNAGSQASDAADQAARTQGIATADGFVDLET
jgi:flagellar hook-length control protein FliK